MPDANSERFEPQDLGKDTVPRGSSSGNDPLTSPFGPKIFKRKAVMHLTSHLNSRIDMRLLQMLKNYLKFIQMSYNALAQMSYNALAQMSYNALAQMS